ncbi:MAG: PEGA domain-containing protein [Pseudomonadota bacterium]
MAEGENLVFGKYRVIRRIAVGGMGEIFLARQTGVAGFDRLVILKTMLPDLVEEEGFLDQFLDEARVAATLNHPNIVNIYEVGQWQGVYIISMEYIKGDHLGRLIQSSIKAKKPIPYLVASKIVHDAALALDHAHFAVDTDGKPLSIVHRDVGLQNIMVRLDGVAKVVDFGVARAANRSTRTRTGMVKGKLPYMSPEQAAGADLDGRSDQFSLGVVLWEMATRRRLFKSDNDLITLRKLIHEPIPAPSTVVPDFPVPLDAIIMRMLQRDREARFPRCADAAAAIQAFLDSTPTPVGESAVSAYVRDVLAEKVEEDLHDLTPTSESPFAAVIGIGGITPTGQRFSGSQHLGDSRETLDQARRGRRNLVLGVVAGALVLAAAGIGSLRLLQTPGSNSDVVMEIEGPRGAQVFVDDKEWRERAPTIVTGLPVGVHEVRLEIEGRPPMIKKVTLIEGKTNNLRRMKPFAGTALDIQEPVGAGVFIDDKPWPEKVPTLITGLPAGPHQVQLKLPNRPVLDKTLTLTEGEQTTLSEKAPVQAPRLAVNSVPTGALVKLDDAAAGKTPLTLSTLEPSRRYRLAIEKSGYEPMSTELSLQPGETRELNFPLFKSRGKPATKKPPATTPTVTTPTPAIETGNGFLSVRTTPWTKVFIDGKPYGSTPLYKEELPAGRHTVKLVNESAGIDNTRKVTIQPGKTEKLDVTLGD